MIKKFYQSIIPFLTLKILVFTLKFSCKVLQNIEFKLEHSEKLNGKSILIDSLVELLSTLKQSLTISHEIKKAKTVKNQPTENKRITQK